MRQAALVHVRQASSADIIAVAVVIRQCVLVNATCWRVSNVVGHFSLLSQRCLSVSHNVRTSEYP